MDEQLKALLEGINALKSGQEETKEIMENMQRSQEETKNELKEGMQKGLQDMQKIQEETKAELKERMENMQRSQEETKERMEKGQEDLRNTLEKKIDSAEEKIALKVDEKIVVVEEKMEKKVEEKIETIREEVAGNFSLISQRVEDLEKNASENATNDSKFVPASSVHMPSSTLPLTSSPVSVKLSTYEYFVDGLKDGEIQKVVRMADVQDLKSTLLYALKLEAATQASHQDCQSIRRARVTLDAPCESPWKSDIEKLRDEYQAFKAQQGQLSKWIQRLQEYDVEIRHRKGSAHGNADALSRRPCPESCKYCSRIEKKFVVQDPIVRQVTAPSTSALNPWRDE
ncbi:uncharacterized protein TNCV_2178311 [Trichonephila clavipes]|uniref:Uncharacterized protein n=1 Tax=Trichonephila clavipes TaxID=2585209 RepID=A0A8X6VUB6_TRICX|nr:uncharacterized protein TNCV_2178311 [Trichonephila clavipes]